MPPAGKGDALSSSAALGDRLYQPDAFIDSHLPEVLQENCRLKSELQRLTVEMNELQMKSDVAMNQLEDSMKR